MSEALQIFQDSDLTPEIATNLIQNTLLNSDDGELYLELKRSESVSFDDGRIRNASFNISKGFGVRSVCNELVGYAHSSDISKDSLKKACDAATITRKGYQGIMSPSPIRSNQHYYEAIDPLSRQDMTFKVNFLQEIDSYIRQKEPSISQVSLSMLASYQNIMIIRGDGSHYFDNRPLVRINFSVITQKGERRESGFYGTGGRVSYDEYLKSDSWKKSADEAIRQSLTNQEAVNCPAGETEVILGAGWPGVMLHEAVGHGLEGDFNRKKTSAFSGLMGQKVAADGVTVVDDGTLHNRRGSLSIDDEGTPTQCTPLIENGILTGYMQDRQNARLMDMKPTGNGRRESYEHIPLPRMTNTFMLGGNDTLDDMISSVKNGLYAVNFGGGQVDITSGKFVFDCTEAYKIENGKITTPVKGATLIGSGPEALKYITMIGNDMKLDEGVGTCGKAGQGIPCGVGQPSMKLSKILVGGTETMA
jgi:TldD protein